MKLVKERIAIWFNRTHHRYGPLWANRFKSVLIDGERELKLSIAAYIDLNPVRAGLVRDPKDYRFCGYAEAVAGNRVAQEGIMAVMGVLTWPEAQADYRHTLFGIGSGVRDHGRMIPVEQFNRVAKEGGKLPLVDLLRCRVRYFTDTAVLGSQMFVERRLAAYRHKTGLRLHTPPRILPVHTGAGALAALRGLRRHVFG